MAAQLDPRKVAPWLLLAAGAYFLIRWLPRITPAPAPPGADAGSCGTGPFTLDVNQARSIADAIHAVVFEAGEDEAEVTRLITQARTNGDVCRIIQAYGNRRLGLFLGPFTLPQVVSRYLNERISIADPETYIDRINSTFAAKGITFRF